jgi:hypothetical protein
MAPPPSGRTVRSSQSAKPAHIFSAIRDRSSVRL